GELGTNSTRPSEPLLAGPAHVAEHALDDQGAVDELAFPQPQLERPQLRLDGGLLSAGALKGARIEGDNRCRRRGRLRGLRTPRPGGIRLLGVDRAIGQQRNASAFHLLTDGLLTYLSLASVGAL